MKLGYTADGFPFPWTFNAHDYSDLYLMQCVTESQVQKDVLALLHTYCVDAVPIDAGGRRQRGRMMAAAKASGSENSFRHLPLGAEIPPGFSDLEATLAPSGRSLYIEIKAPAWVDGKKKITRAAGLPTAEQLSFLSEKFRRGAIVLVAWSVKDVEDYILPELQKNREALAA